MQRWMRYLWIVSRQMTAKKFAHRLALNQKLLKQRFSPKLLKFLQGVSTLIQYIVRSFSLHYHLFQQVTRIYFHWKLYKNVPTLQSLFITRKLDKGWGNYFMFTIEIYSMAQILLCLMSHLETLQKLTETASDHIVADVVSVFGFAWCET